MRSLFARFASLAIALVMLATLPSCMTMLEDETLVETRHLVTQASRQPPSLTEVSSYDEFKAILLDLIAQRAYTGRIIYNTYDSDIRGELEKARTEILESDPIGAYAVEDIECAATKIVTYFEVDISIAYKRTKQQIDSIVHVSTLPYLRTELLSILSDYRGEAVIQSSLRGLTESDILGYIKDIYYENPRGIVMMPVAAVETYPEQGDERIFELNLGYIWPPNILASYSAGLAGAVRRYAAAAGGENDGEILLSLAENLIGACDYDDGTAKVLGGHGPQNLTATAYGALVTGSAVGEGFAMAYKALCEYLGYECKVILGYLDGMFHAWNIVELYGDYYHTDVSMCAENGLETAFLKNDIEFGGRYLWSSKTVKCAGKLTYEEVAGIEPEEEEIDEDEDEDEETGEGSEGEAGEGSGEDGGPDSGETSGGAPIEGPDGEGSEGSSQEGPGEEAPAHDEDPEPSGDDEG